MPVDGGFENIHRYILTFIFKKGKKQDPVNYRPVSLTALPSNLVEQIFLEGVSKHMKDREVIRGGLYTERV